MKFNRRKLLAGAAAAALLLGQPFDVKAWPFHGQQQIAHGWNTFPLGGGGDIWGLHIANDGSMVCRGDVLGAYVWSGTSSIASLTDPAQKWTQLCSFNALGGTFNGSGVAGYPWEVVQAPGNSNYIYLVTGDVAPTGNYFLYYSINKGVSFTKSALSIPASSGIGPKNWGSYKVGADPNNEKIVYCGMPTSNGKSTSLFTTFDRTSGQVWPTFNGAFTDTPGTSLFPQCTFGGISAVSGIVFDTNVASGGGTTTIGGQTVTKRILVCIGGVDVYESLDGGVSWSATGLATLIGTGNFAVNFGRLDAAGNYFCNISTGKVYRYVGGGSSGWKDISPSSYANQALLAVDPRNGQTYLTSSGANGVTNGFTTTNSTATTPTWNGSTSPRNVTLSAPSYDIPWMNYLFGQGSAVGYTDGNCVQVDLNGTYFWGGNQSIWYFSSLPDWGVSTTSTSISFGRGQEGVVGCDVICPPGASLPIMACQDIGSPLINGTFVKYPTDLYFRGSESTCQNLDYSPDDSSFIVARQTGQPTQNDAYGDYSAYSNDYGKTWQRINYPTTPVWQTNVSGTIVGTVLTVNSFVSATASCSAGAISGVTFTPGGTTVGTFKIGMVLTWANGSPGIVITHDNGDGTFGVQNSLTVASTAFTGKVSSTNVFPGALVTDPGNGAQIKPYGSDSTTGSGGAGGTTYSLTSAPGNFSGNIALFMPCTAGQGMPADRDHWIVVPDFPNCQYIPAYTSNARSATLGGTTAWALCNGLPAANWMVRGGWSFGDTSKPIAAGYGADLGTVWAALYIASTGAITLYRSTDSGANFTSVATTTGQINAGGVYLLAVPGYPDELWLGINVSSGSPCLWHITGARTAGTPTITAMTGGNLPATYTLLHAMTLGVNPGGYPFLYATFEENGVGQAPSYLHRGTWNGTSLSWSLYGPSGASQGAITQLPNSNQMGGIGFIRGDWGVPGRIFTGNNGFGFAYYNP